LVRGSARFGVSVVYRHGLGEMRLTNLTEEEALEVLKEMGKPDNITTSKANRKSAASDTLKEAQELANRLRRSVGLKPIIFGRIRRRRPPTEYDLEIKTIRRALKSLAPTLSVRKGRGTAYGWIDIRGSGSMGEFTEEERKVLDMVGLGYGVNYSNISPEKRRFWVEKLARLLNLEIPEELRREYEERDRYREEMRRRALERKEKMESCNHDLQEVKGVWVFPSGKLYRCTKCPYEKVVLD